MVQQCLPSLILRRFPKSNRMVFEFIPFHEEQILILYFNTTLKLQCYKTWHRRDKGTRLAKGAFKRNFLTGLNI